MIDKVLILGADELGREYVFAAKRAGLFVITAGNKEKEPAMQVSDERAVIDLHSKKEIDDLVKKYSPDLIILAKFAVNTERFFDYEQNNIKIAPPMHVFNKISNRKSLRDLAYKELGIPSTKYETARNLDELKEAAEHCDYPCIALPLERTDEEVRVYVKSEADLEKAWKKIGENSKVDAVFVEQDLGSKKGITLHTVTQNTGMIQFCPPVGYTLGEGEYKESWQPAYISRGFLKDAHQYAEKILHKLDGAGLWSVYFHLDDNGVQFAGIIPGPDDTGLVTLAGTQEFNEFELELRVNMDIQIHRTELWKIGASAAILADKETDSPRFKDLENVGIHPNTNVELFRKPSAQKGTRMGLVLAYDDKEKDPTEVYEIAKVAASKVHID